MGSSTAGTIITFYSYKGGTGRSMSLANIACLLAGRVAESSQKILVMDWDLEAPGLHRYFAARSEQPENVSRPGVINLFHQLRKLLDDREGLYDELLAPEGWKVLDTLLPLDDYLVTDVVRGVDFIKAGRFDAQYPEMVASFDWADFYNRYGLVIQALRELLSSRYAYCLIDSRTGITDVSGICTMLLPEKLVAVFTPNQQSLYGLLGVTEQAIKYRRASDDFRPLTIFPLPSRIELAEKSLREQWRKQYQREFETLFRRAYEIETSDLDMTAYFDEVQLPHVSYYAYGENIAVLEERSDSLSLSRAYRDFFQRLLELDEAWEVPGQDKTETALPLIKLSEKRYDVFLSYNSTDKLAVEQLASRLEEDGVRVYFDARQLRAGEHYLKALDTAMDESANIAVFIGPDGAGPWQNEEAQVALKLRVQDHSKRVIPVILPGASPDKLPNYLKSLLSVDFRAGLDDAEAYGRLVSGVTDKVTDRVIKGGYDKRGRKSSLFLPQTWSRRTVILAALSVIAVSIIAFAAYYYYRATRPIDSIAVLPFTDINPQPDTENLGDEITKHLIYSLSKLSPNLRVVPFTETLRFKDQSPQEAGRALNVRAVLSGRIARSGDTVTISVELVDLRDNRVLWGERPQTKFSDLTLALHDIVTAVSDSIGLKLSAEAAKKRDAESLYMLGRNAWNKRTADAIKEAAGYFNEALKIDPNYAPAYAGLADSYNMLATYGASAPTDAFPKAINEAEAALRLDNNLAEAHAALAYAKFRGEWNWPAAEREFQEAILLNPNYASAHQWYANYLAAMRRFDEAEAETRRTQELDKTSLIINSHFGLIYFFAGRFDDAIAACKKTIELDPNFFVARRYLGLSYAQKGMSKEAVAEYEKALEASKGSALMRAEYASVLALNGERDKAQTELSKLLDEKKTRYISAYHIATIYAALKDRDRTFEMLEQAYRERADWMVFLNVDPRFKSLRSDARFTDMLQRMRFG
jgi:TolB-like protein/Tfp pilus assembly protein PilF/cellulose biosynthesis protein BcsQ